MHVLWSIGDENHHNVIIPYHGPAWRGVVELIHVIYIDRHIKEVTHAQST